MSSTYSVATLALPEAMVLKIRDRVDEIDLEAMGEAA